MKWRAKGLEGGGQVTVGLQIEWSEEEGSWGRRRRVEEMDVKKEGAIKGGGGGRGEATGDRGGGGINFSCQDLIRGKYSLRAPPPLPSTARLITQPRTFSLSHTHTHASHGKRERFIFKHIKKDLLGLLDEYTLFARVPVCTCAHGLIDWPCFRRPWRSDEPPSALRLTKLTRFEA